MTVIAADIGGTHARFARVANGRLQDPVRYQAGDFENLEAALESYRKKPGTLLIATAAQREADDIWRFHNKNSWQIDLQALSQAGWDVALMINDFMAAARGAVSLTGDSRVVLRPGRARDGNSPSVILGPGTGLGLAYVLPLVGGHWHVQETFGGHMLAAAVTDEQHRVLQLIERLNHNGRVPVPEDIVSGRALPVLHKAVCLVNGWPVEGQPADLLAFPERGAVRETLRLFHEFLGLFAHHAVVTGHGFGGLYLDGGLVSTLYDRNLLDMESFSRYFILDVAPVVKAALETVPVWLVRDPYVAMKGLAALYQGHE